MNKVKEKLLGLSKSNLNELSKELGVTGYNKLSKDELITELSKTEYRKILYKKLKIKWYYKYPTNLFKISSGLIIPVVAIIIPIYINNNSKPLSKDNVKIGVSILNDQIYDEHKAFIDDSLFAYEYFWYKDSLIKNIHYVFPKNKYLTSFYNNKVSLDWGHPWWEWIMEPRNPKFDIKIVNNSDETLVIDKILIDVEKSEKDKRPFFFIFIQSETTSAIELVNDCWDEWEECDFNFSFGRDASSFNGNYKYSKKIKYFKFSNILSFVPELRKEGVKYNELLKLRWDEDYLIGKSTDEINYEIEHFEFPIRGKTEFEKVNKLIPYPTKLEIGENFFPQDEDFTNIDDIDDSEGFDENFYPCPKIYLFGELRVKGYEHAIKVEGFIPIAYPGGGADLDLGLEFNAYLKDEGSNYTIEYPVSLMIKPKEAEKVDVNIGAPRSSFHLFKFRIANINGVNIESQKIKLDYFRQKNYMDDKFDSNKMEYEGEDNEELSEKERLKRYNKYVIR